MNTTKQQDFLNYLAAKCDDFKNCEQLLKEDQRKDEANHAKIQMNIYQIFQTIFQVTIKKSKVEEVEQDFLAQLERIPQSWEKALENARLHQDVEREFIENLKFQMRDRIREEFLKVVNEE